MYRPTAGRGGATDRAHTRQRKAFEQRPFVHDCAIHGLRCRFARRGRCGPPERRFPMTVRRPMAEGRPLASLARNQGAQRRRAAPDRPSHAAGVPPARRARALQRCRLWHLRMYLSDKPPRYPPLRCPPGGLAPPCVAPLVKGRMVLRGSLAMLWWQLQTGTLCRMYSPTETRAAPRGGRRQRRAASGTGRGHGPDRRRAVRRGRRRRSSP